MNICIKDADCKGNYGNWKLVGTSDYFFAKNVCMPKVSIVKDEPITTLPVTGEKPVETTVVKREDVPATVTLKPTIVQEEKKVDPTKPVEKVEKVVLKTEGADCGSTNECANTLGCLWVVDKRGTEGMKCVEDNNKGCLVGVKNMLYIKGISYMSKMDYCLPRIYVI